MALSLDSSNNRRGRRRRRGRGRRALSEINVTPLVDVMLVLLIIFMVSAPLLTAGVPLQLPKSNQTEPLTVSVRADGSVYVQATEVPFGDLAPRMRALAQAGFDKPIYVRADGRAPYAIVAQVMASLSESGFSSINLLTDTGGPSSGLDHVAPPSGDGSATGGAASGGPAANP